MTRTIAATAAALMLMTAGALADPIEGNWKTGSGGSTRITKCGGAFCVTVTSGEHSGKQIGRFEKKGERYEGRITDPANNKTYKGRASLSGNTLSMTGCWAVCTALTSRTESWKRR